MEFKEMLDWAFERHLNPLSWYIRPIFLVLLAYSAYKRSWKWIIIVFLVMMSSMVWFPAPETINSQMQTVLEFEQTLLSSPLTAAITLAFMMLFMVAVGAAFWNQSLKLGLIILNVTMIGKPLISVLFTGDDGWASLGNTIFGLLLVNGIAAGIYFYRRSHHKMRTSPGRK